MKSTVHTNKLTMTNQFEADIRWIKEHRIEIAKKNKGKTVIYSETKMGRGGPKLWDEAQIFPPRNSGLCNRCIS